MAVATNSAAETDSAAANRLAVIDDPRPPPGVADQIGGNVEDFSDAVGCEHLLRRSIAGQAPPLQHYNAVAVGESEVQVVRYGERKQPAPGQLAHEPVRLHLVLEIQICSGL